MASAISKSGKFPRTWSPYFDAVDRAQRSHMAFESDRLQFLTDTIMLHQWLQTEKGRAEIKYFGLCRLPKPKRLMAYLLRFHYSKRSAQSLDSLLTLMTDISARTKRYDRIRKYLKMAPELRPWQAGWFRLTADG